MKVLSHPGRSNSHRTLQLWCKDAPVCLSFRKLALWNIKRHDSKRNKDDVCVFFSKSFPAVYLLPNLNMYALTFYKSYGYCYNV